MKIHRMDKEMTERRFHLKQTLGFSEVWIKKTEKWVWNSLSESISKVKASLEKKLKELRKQKQESQSSRSKLKGVCEKEGSLQQQLEKVDGRANGVISSWFQFWNSTSKVPTGGVCYVSRRFVSEIGGVWGYGISREGESYSKCGL